MKKSAGRWFFIVGWTMVFIQIVAWTASPDTNPFNISIYTDSLWWYELITIPAKAVLMILGAILIKIGAAKKRAAKSDSVEEGPKTNEENDSINTINKNDNNSSEFSIFTFNNDIKGLRNSRIITFIISVVLFLLSTFVVPLYVSCLVLGAILTVWLFFELNISWHAYKDGADRKTTKSNCFRVWVLVAIICACLIGSFVVYPIENAAPEDANRELIGRYWNDH